MQSFAAQSNCLLITNALPSGPIWHLRPTGPFRWWRQNGLFWSMQKLNPPRVKSNRGAIQEQIYYSHTSCTSAILTTGPIGTLVPWILNNHLGAGSRDRRTDRQGRRVVNGTPRCSRRDASKRLNGLPNRSQPNAADSMRLWTQVSGCAVNNSSTPSICYWDLGLLPIGCSGFREPVFSHWSSSHYSVSRAGIFIKMRIAKLFSEGIANTLDWFNFFILQAIPFASSFERGQWILSAKWGYSANHSFQFHWVVKYCMEIKCPNTHFLGKHQLTSQNPMRFHVPCFILYHYLRSTCMCCVCVRREVLMIQSFVFHRLVSVNSAALKICAILP